MVKKMKKVLSTALSIFLMLSVVIQTSIVYAEEGKTGSEYYLSDLKWVSASHGDYDTTKEVQKDHPFTPGNNGEDTKISLARIRICIVNIQIGFYKPREERIHMGVINMY